MHLALSRKPEIPSTGNWFAYGAVGSSLISTSDFRKRMEHMRMPNVSKQGQSMTMYDNVIFSPFHQVRQSVQSLEA